MPFSFNPNQEQPAGAASGWQAAPDTVGVPTTAPVSNSNSPILFLREPAGAKSVNAYVQLLLMLITVVFALASLALFLYGLYLTSSIESIKSDLAAKEAGFKTYPIDDMRDLSNRTAKVSQLLTDYVSIRSPLKFLENVVEKNVVFNDFVLKKGDAGYVANFVAITTDYPSLIQQLAALKLTEYSKVAPSSKTTNFMTGSAGKANELKVSIVSPVFVQGILPDEVVFLPPAKATSTDQKASSSSSVSAPAASGTPLVKSSFQ